MRDNKITRAAIGAFTLLTAFFAMELAAGAQTTASAEADVLAGAGTAVSAVYSLVKSFGTSAAVLALLILVMGLRLVFRFVKRRGQAAPI